MTRVGIIDFGISNLASVTNAFAHLELDIETTRSPADLCRYSHLVLPGVGSFPSGMAMLRQTGLADELCRQAEKGKPIIGLCLGMQLLAEEGEEFEATASLGLIPGRVRKLAPRDQSLRLPHIGWNEVVFRRHSPLFDGLGDGAAFYFVHSYAYDDVKSDTVTGTCEYGGDVVALVESQNVFGAQFHPEKSQKAGLKLLENFVRLC